MVLKFLPLLIQYKAFKNLEQNIQEYRLIVSDYRMPKLNGHDLCTKLKQLNPELKVILMSAYETLECNTSKFMFIKKPILIAQLLHIVRVNLAENISIITKKS
jgi:DNA-binding NtrC family response regulator